MIRGGECKLQPAFEMAPAELVVAGQARGYHFEPRTLTDWRHKGLLPPLRQIGLGRGKGKRQVWTDPDIVDQAIMVAQLLARRSRTRPALLRLWRVGFRVPSELAREIWLEQLDEAGVMLDENEIARRVGTVVRALRRKEHLDRDAATPALIVLFDALYASGSAFEPSEVEPIQQYLATFLNRMRETPHPRTWLDEERVTSVQRIIAKVFSRGALRAWLCTAPIEDLEWINTTMRRLRVSLARTAETRRMAASREFSGASETIITILSTPLILTLSLLLRSGYGTHVNATLDAAEKAINVLGDEAQLPSVALEIREIWTDVELGTLLRRATG